MNGRLLNKKLHNQLGFTLLELLVVIAVIGVLASLAVPRLQSQVQKARFLNVINSTAPFKAGVEICFQKTGTLAGCTAGTNEVPANVGLAGADDSIIVGNSGVITARGSAASGFQGVVQDLTLTPTNAGGGLTWVVGGSCLTSNFCN